MPDAFHGNGAGGEIKTDRGVRRFRRRRCPAMRMPAASSASTAAWTLLSPICMNLPSPNMQAPPTILAISLPSFAPWSLSVESMWGTAVSANLAGLAVAPVGVRQHDVAEHAQPAPRRIQRHRDAGAEDRRQPGRLGGERPPGPFPRRL